MKTGLAVFLISILIISSVYVQAATPEERKSDLIRQMNEATKFLFDLTVNGVTDEEVYFNLSTGEEWVATREFENGKYVYSATPVKPEEPPESLTIATQNNPEPPKASHNDLSVISEEELNLAIGKANQLWEVRVNNREAEIFSLPPYEKQWKMVPIKTESGIVYSLFRQGIVGEITRGPREVPKAKVAIASEDPKETVLPESSVTSDAPVKAAAENKGAPVVAGIEKPKEATPTVEETFPAKQTAVQQQPQHSEKNDKTPLIVKIFKWLFRK